MSAELDQDVQEVVARIARDDPTMTNANLSSECAAADGAAAVALLQMQQGRVRGVCAPLNRRGVYQDANLATRGLHGLRKL